MKPRSGRSPRRAREKSDQTQRWAKITAGKGALLKRGESVCIGEYRLTIR